jgi:DNA-binding NarL/FixJ family response regulator
MVTQEAFNDLNYMQKKIVQLVMEDKTNVEIADFFGLTTDNVRKNHMSRLYRHFGIESEFGNGIKRQAFKKALLESGINLGQI